MRPRSCMRASAPIIPPTRNGSMRAWRYCGKPVKKNFPEYEHLEADVRECAQYALDNVRRAYPQSRAAQMSVLRWCSEFADHVEPNGSPRGKFSGIFGGPLFRRRPTTTDRAAAF